MPLTFRKRRALTTGYYKECSELLGSVSYYRRGRRWEYYNGKKRRQLKPNKIQNTLHYRRRKHLAFVKGAGPFIATKLKQETRY